MNPNSAAVLMLVAIIGVVVARWGWWGALGIAAVFVAIEAALFIPLVIDGWRHREC